MCCEIFNGYIVWGHATKFPDVLMEPSKDTDFHLSAP